MKFLVLMLLPLTANTPVPNWVLVPQGFVEHNLCLRECVLKVYVVDGYRWEAR